MDLRQRLVSLIASPRFQSWAAAFPLIRRTTRREGEAIFDLVAGFVHSQVLGALVGLGLLDRLLEGPEKLARLSVTLSVPDERLAVLLRAAAALDLVRFDGISAQLTGRGAALTGVPGLSEMIRHHEILYRDLADPVAFFRGETDPELAKFWPYVFGTASANDPTAAARYSDLMAETQRLVSEETLAAISLRKVHHLLDVGGGTGVFLTEALSRNPELRGTLFDLPAVLHSARDRVSRAGVSERIALRPGSFSDDPLPNGADAISLVRVLYDHTDETVAALLASVRAALPSGGRLIVSEPMSGGARPTKAGDVYFAIYTMAMGTGRTRSANEISSHLRAAGFLDTQPHPTRRPFITSVITARAP